MTINFSVLPCVCWILVIINGITSDNYYCYNKA